MATSDHFSKLEIVAPEDATRFRETRILLNGQDITRSVQSIRVEFSAKNPIPTASVMLRVLPYVSGSFVVKESDFIDRVIGSFPVEDEQEANTNGSGKE